MEALTPRQAFRHHGRQVLQQPLDAGRHLARIAAALELPGAEPVQGSLGDLFAACTAASAQLRRSALEMARGRLSRAAARAFEQLIGQPDPRRCSVLATRWSVLASPSLDVPRRTLRCSADDSRRLAEEAVSAFGRGDLASQEEFLGHCVECGDVLAFMLARRALTRHGTQLPARWETVCSILQRERLK